MTLELSFGIAGIIIALAAAITTIWQGFLTRKHNRLSVKPILRIDRNITLDDNINIELLNNGVGPAIIKSVKYFVDNNEIVGDKISTQVLNKLGLFDSYKVFEISSGEALSSGEKRSLFKLLKNVEVDALNDIMNAFKRFSIEIKYESIYNETSLIINRDNRNENKVTIDQGAWGNVHFWEGDFMPMYDPETGGTITPVVRDIYIHEATTTSMVDKIEYTPFYTKINSELIGVVQSDKDGFFQFELEPGKYSFFVKEDLLFYANHWDGEGHILAAEVTKDSVTQVRIDITYKATF